VTKEFTSFEKDVSVPEPELLRMSSLILAAKVNPDSPYSEFNKAFQVGKLQLYPSPRNTFFNEERLFLFFQVYGLTPELERNGTLEFTFLKGELKFHTLTKEIKKYRKRRDFLQDFPLDKFPPGKYQVKVSLFNEEGREVLFEKEDFTLSSKALPESWIVSQTNPSLKGPVYFLLSGNQYFNKGEIRKARRELEKAYQQEPGAMDFALGYARVLLLLKEFQKAHEILLPFVEEEKQEFQLYYYLGLSSQAEGKMEAAISFYQKALSHKGNIKEVLNSIGECFFQLGDREQALRAWQKSIEIDPNQKKVKQMVEKLSENN
jgi:tetratricopeptide (TPR) repeat protein